MRHWALVGALPLLALPALGGSPGTGIQPGTSFQTPVIQGINITFTDANGNGILESGETSVAVVNVTHTGHLGTVRLAVKAGDNLGAGEYLALSDNTRGEQVSDTVTRYTTNVITRDLFETVAQKTVEVSIYPGSAQIETECSSTGAGETLPACSDGVDNDGDGDTDFPADAQCASELDTREAATGGGCGLGFELIFLAPLLRALARRRR